MRKKAKEAKVGEVQVEASIYVEGDKGEDRWGGSISLRRVRGKDLIQLSAHGNGGFLGGGGPVEVDPRKLRAALDSLVNENLGP